MLLTITTTHEPATDLGFLLHKHPDRYQVVELALGQAHVFYPEASATRCTAALLMELDPIALARGKEGDAGGGALEPYVNDRPYVASSFLTTAISRVFGTALSGVCKNKPELVDALLPLELRLDVLPCRGGADLVRRLFEPLGYEVEVHALPLDERFPEWGDSSVASVCLRGAHRLADALSHLYLLIPVLDDAKHYFVGDEEVNKLMRHGEGWLATHPEREAITRRYLERRGALVRDAMARFQTLDGLAAEDEVVVEAESPEEAQEEAPKEAPKTPRLHLHKLRIDFAAERLASLGAARVLDLGCGEGRLIKRLLTNKAHAEIVGVDVSHRELEIAGYKLKLERLSTAQRARVKLLHGCLTYRDARLKGFDAAALVEVIEHVDLERLPALEDAVFGHAAPRAVIVTTPNAEYNAIFEEPRAMRHEDHRFEWDRATFEAWAARVADRYGYAVTTEPLGPLHEALGAPSQAATFVKR
jgi:3' terminal RNA ribose 2'-O-methyltransferase Hen1